MDRAAGNGSSHSNNNNNGNGNSDFIVAAVALVVSVVALLATCMQVLQQYYASAQGYSQCNDRVMGGWATTKSRRFQWDELRFEVQFDAPVIFISPPSNKNGPIPDAPIYFLDGSDQSLENTWTTSDMDLRKEYSKKSQRERIHTADNERASWFVLLYALQRMEKKSREWQETEYTDMGPPGELSNLYQLPQKPPTLQDHHTLTAAVQRKRKSWDTMPASVIKPYATTTICHLIEMMAALGVYWKEFDRRRDRYWAEGNGFTVLGERLSDLGLMFSFQVSGQCEFAANRVIPVDEVKELCFGYIPTIFRKKLDQRRLKQSRFGQNLGYLAMGSRGEIAETLTVIGCNNNTVRYFLDDNKVTSHLFPVSFEILGMLCRPLHIENSSFTYIPNPTPDILDKRALSLSGLLNSYFINLEEQVPVPGIQRNLTVINCIKVHIESILSHDPEKGKLHRHLRLRALHLALEDADEILTAKPKKRQQQQEQANDSFPDGRAFERASTGLYDVDLAAYRQQIVQDVLRHHIQEVLRLLNEGDDRAAESSSRTHLGTHLGVVPRSPPLRGVDGRMGGRSDLPRAPSRRFEEMNAAGPDDRQEIFMDVYFDTIRYVVVSHAAIATDRRNSIAGGSARSSLSLRRSSVPVANNNAAASLAVPTAGVGTGDKEEGTILVTSRDSGEIPSAEEEEEEEEEEQEEEKQSQDDVPLHEQEVSHDDIWCTLVFRMICWLMLHNFHRNDIQLSKSELLGSRMPVYIS